MLKVNKITVENFRGIKLPVALDFKKNGKHTSAILYGRNGTGKSSLVDAWEWLNNNGVIESLNREGISVSDYPHRSCGGTDCHISVELDHATISHISSAFNSKKISMPLIEGDFAAFKALSTYPNYLRYVDLQDFVFKRKTEKYRYIAKFFGLEAFIKNQDDISATLNRLSATLQGYNTNSQEAQNSVTAIIDQKHFDDNVIIIALNNIAARYSIAPIVNFKEAILIKESLDKIVQEDPVTKELTEWKSFLDKINAFYPIQDLEPSCKELEETFDILKKDEESIKNLILTGLYETAINIIPQLEDQEKCPICDATGRANLLSHVKEKHDALDELVKKKKNFERLKPSIESALHSILRKVQNISGEKSTTVLTTLNLLFQDIESISSTLPDILIELKKPLNDINEINLYNSILLEKIESLIEKEHNIREQVTDRVALLEGNTQRKDLADDFGTVIKLTDSYQKVLVCTAKINYLEDIISNLTVLLGQLTLFIQTTIQDTFTIISTDVVECFNILEVANRFIKNPELKLIPGKDKAVELEIEFATEKTSPAFKFMSESQVNSFGLAIFLSAVKHFNKDFKFFILDDVVNSFDSFKRPKVIELIATKFSDFQVLMLTHDQIFFDTVQKAFPNWQRYKFTSWDFATGPKFKLAKNYNEAIKNHLDEDEPKEAGNSLGVYFEWTFGLLSERMKVALPYKIENVYTLIEFFEPLKKKFKDKLKDGSKEHKLLIAFDELEKIVIFRNYCAHWKNEANSYTSIEIEEIFNKWMEIEEMIYCQTCKSFTGLSSANNSDYVKCGCNAINLKDLSYYQ
ncbi:hypothetical protein SAMN05421827_12852 [Pedobacter terrae]|uniref:RecF/RecN/SMC family protein n=1 Tax=Pedobacter terrae TaxID=405671 RepID=A0A1G8D9I6_9SPHI|nr:hypothetical protein [Pedobacter terrae]SDH54204.1 hypothetical protein SAMN05421827_12852 [Pedobacter terrae]